MSDNIYSSATTTADDSDGRAARDQQAYKTTVADLAVDADKMVELWRTGLLQNGMPDAKLDWYYRHNPEGAPLVVFLHHRDVQHAVGVASVGLRRIRFGSETLMVGALVDFVLQPEHRTFFPAMFLQKELRRCALGAHTVLFGFPNAKSLAIVSRVGYRCVGQMVRRTRVLRSAAYLAKYLPGRLSRIMGAVIDGLRSTEMWLRGLANNSVQTQWRERPDSTFDELWQRIVMPDVVMGVRDMAFLTWRFVNVPSKSFRFFTLVSSVDRRLLAYAACAPNGAVLNVQDFLVDPEMPSAGRRLWLDLSREAMRMGYTSLCIEFLGSDQEQRQLSAAGLRFREQRPAYASVAQSPDGASVWPTETSTWYLTSADDDW